MVSLEDVGKIPNKILCYWLGKSSIRKYYEGIRLDNFADPRVGLTVIMIDL